jgi:hypothetical protein
MKEEGGFFFFTLCLEVCAYPKTLVFPAKKLQHNYTQKQAKF